MTGDELPPGGGRDHYPFSCFAPPRRPARVASGQFTDKDVREATQYIADRHLYGLSLGEFQSAVEPFLLGLSSDGRRAAKLRIFNGLDEWLREELLEEIRSTRYEGAE